MCRRIILSIMLLTILLTMGAETPNVPAPMPGFGNESIALSASLYNDPSYSEVDCVPVGSRLRLKATASGIDPGETANIVIKCDGVVIGSGTDNPLIIEPYPSTDGLSLAEHIFLAQVTPSTGPVGNPTTGPASQPATKPVVAKGVSKIQYKDGTNWVDVPNPLVVMKDTEVTFKAISDPATGTWPSNKPVWGGTAGANGIGETKALTFGAKGDKTVTAECGNTVSANVKVYELTGVHVAQDFFAGRNTTKYGVAEVADLSFTVDPAGISAAQMGGLEWSVAGGGGTVANTGTTGAGTYTAPDRASANVTLRLTVLAGPSKNKYAEMALSVVEPSDFVFTQHGAGVRHDQGHGSCGVLFDTYLHPKDVSFRNIEFGEAGVQSVRVGWFLLKYPDPAGRPHPANDGATVGNGDAANGCLVAPPDQAWSGWEDPPPAYAAGSHTWPIKQRWRVGAGGWVEMRAADQVWTIDVNGTVTMQKDGAPNPAASKALNAASSNW